MTVEVMNFFACFILLKQEHVEGNTGCIGFPHLFNGPLSLMVVIANFLLDDDSALLKEWPHRVVK